MEIDNIDIIETNEKNYEFRSLKNDFIHNKKSYEIKSNNVINFNEYNEYQEINKFFNNSNILDFSNSKYSVILNNIFNSFYVKNNDSEQIYKCYIDDIKNIYYSVYGITNSYVPIKYINVNIKKLKFNMSNKIFNKNKLNIRLFEVFIKTNFNITKTIDILNQ